MLPMGYRHPARVNERRGHSMGERGHLATQRTPGEQEPWPRGSCCLLKLVPWGLVLDTGTQVHRR